MNSCIVNEYRYEEYRFSARGQVPLMEDKKFSSPGSKKVDTIHIGLYVVKSNYTNSFVSAMCYACESRGGKSSVY